MFPFLGVFGTPSRVMWGGPGKFLGLGKGSLPFIWGLNPKRGKGKGFLGIYFGQKGVSQGFFKPFFV